MPQRRAFLRIPVVGPLPVQVRGHEAVIARVVPPPDAFRNNVIHLQAIQHHVGSQELSHLLRGDAVSLMMSHIAAKDGVVPQVHEPATHPMSECELACWRPRTNQKKRAGTPWPSMRTNLSPTARRAQRRVDLTHFSQETFSWKRGGATPVTSLLLFASVANPTELKPPLLDKYARSSLHLSRAAGGDAAW